MSDVLHPSPITNWLAGLQASKLVSLLACELAGLLAWQPAAGLDRIGRACGKVLAKGQRPISQLAL